MSKYTNYLTHTEYLQNYNNYITSQQNEKYDQAQISFDHLIQIQKNSLKTSPSVDKIFDQIQLNQQNIIKKININDTHKYKQNLEIKLSKNQQNSKRDKIDKIDKIDKKQRDDLSRRIQQQLTKGRDRHKKSITKLDIDKQQISNYKKQNQQLKNTLKQYKLQNISLKQTILKLNQTIIKLTNIQKQYQYQKQQNKLQKIKIHKFIQQKQKKQKKLIQITKINEQIQKKLRIKQKQLKNLQQKYQERNKYYQQFFKNKMNQIQKLNIQLNKKSEQIYLIQQQNVINKQKIHKQLKQVTQQKQILQSKIQEYNKQVQVKLQNQIVQANCKINKIMLQNQQRIKIMQRSSRLINQCVEYLEEYLKQPIQKSSNFSSINTANYSNQYKSTQIINKMDESYLKYLLSLILQTIERNKMITKRKQVQINNFRQIYSTQIDNLDHKMQYLAKQNESLKLQNHSITQSFSKMQLLQQKRKINQINSIKQFMSAKINNFSKIRQQLSQPRPIQSTQSQFVDKIQKAREIYNQVSLRNQSAGTLRKRSRYLSENNLHKRQRKSLSWKKPSEVLKQYI